MKFLKKDVLTSRDKLFLAIYSLFAAFILLPLLSELLPLDSQTVDIFVSVTCIVLYPGAYKNKLMAWAICYFLVLYLFVISGNDITIGIGKATPSKKLLIEMAWMLPSFCIVSILWFRDSHKLYCYVAIISILIYIVSFVSVLPIIMQYDMRYLTLHEDMEISFLGLPSYTLMHAFTISLPVTFMGYRVTVGKYKTIALTLLICNIILVVNTNITTSLVALFICFVFFLSYGKENGINLSRLMTLLICVFLLSTFNIVEYFLEYLCDWFEGTAVQPKLESFLAIYQGGVDETGSVTGRENLHAISIESFFSNIIWGGGQAGGHSAILDRLGGMGLLVGLPFIMLLVSQMMIWKNRFCNHLSRSYYYLGVGIATVFLYTKGLFGEEGWFMVSIFVPVVIYVCSIYAAEKKLNSK